MKRLRYELSKERSIILHDDTDLDKWFGIAATTFSFGMYCTKEDLVIMKTAITELLEDA